ncbi:tail fiber protein [Gordonia phage Denise]|uniref:Uncharacterized protein n=1 Tax=Gordonia phage Denise TaxID=2652879 RepID=A0A5P8DCD9_9CAUD|nr:tail fiber protein [Gordonia phage Denise]QFP96664.1 hypothetical protein SEA_DENISE_49 [Gordonia phage Denise]
MTAPFIHPAAIDAALPDFDAEVACDFLLTVSDESCGNGAVWRVRAHGRRSPRETRCADHTILMCDPCLAYLIAQVGNELADEQAVLCGTCGRISTQVSDTILSVVAL